jgi:hypothetical protein
MNELGQDKQPNKAIINNSSDTSSIISNKQGCMGSVSVNRNVVDKSLQQTVDNSNNSRPTNLNVTTATATTADIITNNNSTNMGSDNNSESILDISMNNNINSIRSTTSRARSRSLSNGTSPGGLSIGNMSSHSNESSHNSCSCRIRFCKRIVSIRSIADVLASKIPLFDTILYNGTMVGVGVIGVYCIIVIILWIPLYCVSYITSEIGFYVLLLLLLIHLGRTVLRLLAFPAATSSKVKLDIETEFCNYSIRILSAAFQSI